MWQFQGILENFNTALWSYHIKVPYAVWSAIKANNIKRIRCQLADDPEQSAIGLMPAGEEVYFININKAKREKHQLRVGAQILVTLIEDKSEYGMDMPEELEEILNTDDVFSKHFHALTPGHQRNLIYIVAKYKSVDKRIEKALIIARHLITEHGKLDFKILNQAFKAGL